jgi:hypothetical protein
MTRRTIGENPLDALVPPPTETRKAKASPRKATERPQEAPRTAKERLTVHLPMEVIERARNAVFWTPGLTLAGLAETAFVEALHKLEKTNGGPFPRRKADLKGGRPVK